MWLVGWLAGELLAVAVLAFLINGREVLEIDDAELRLRAEALGRSWTRRYPLAEAANLRPVASSGGSLDFLAFEYRGKTVRFGTDLSEADADAHRAGRLGPSALASRMSRSAETAQPKGRIVAYDALRLFAILSVVGIHTLMPYRGVLPASAPVSIFDDVLHYAVPLFVFISGALVWARPWRRGPGAYRQFLGRRFVAIGTPYLAWAALYAALYVARATDRASALAQVPGLVASGHIWYHLYFIPMLLTFYVLTPLAAGALKRSPELTVLAAYALRIVLGPPITHALADVNPLLGQYGIHVLSHLPHMALGAWFALRLDTIGPRIRRWWPAMLAAGLAALAYLSASGTPSWPLELHRLLFPGAMALTVIGFALGAIELEPHYAQRPEPSRTWGRCHSASTSCTR